MKKITVVIAVLIICVISMKEEKIIIPESAIRFRIIANSNTIEDQKIKGLVEEKLTKYLDNIVKNSKKENVKKELLLKREEINMELKNILSEINVDETFKVDIGKNYFPVKKFKGISYDAGYYESLVVTLGRGNGLNWWCVMYPPLCLIDENIRDVEYTTLVKEILSKYNL